MRKIIQRIVSLVIVLAFSLSLVSTAYAAENISSSNLPVDYSSSEKENAKAVYEGCAAGISAGKYVRRRRKSS